MVLYVMFWANGTDVNLQATPEQAELG